MSTYCDIAPGHPFHGPYHDHEYGFPIEDDNLLFGRLILEINQAGLSWLTILKKKEAFQDAFDRFDIERVANYKNRDRERLLNNSGIIRNRLKIDAVIYNAQQILPLQDSHGSFLSWLDHHHPLPKENWVRLFKKNFKFTGGEITGEFLMSTGFLPGAHAENCPVFERLGPLNPRWMDT